MISRNEWCLDEARRLDSVRVDGAERPGGAGLCLGSAMVERGLLVRGGAVELLADADAVRGATDGAVFR